MDELAGERRSRRRYRLELPVRYRVLKKNHYPGSGVGITRDISSGGIAVASDAELPAGSIIELWVVWPVVAEDVTCVELRIAGRVVRSSHTEAGIQMKRHEFLLSRKEVAAENGGDCNNSKVIGRTDRH
jgi:hypothetical protein